MNSKENNAKEKLTNHISDPEKVEQAAIEGATDQNNTKGIEGYVEELKEISKSVPKECPVLDPAWLRNALHSHAEEVRREERERVKKKIDWILTSHGYESDDPLYERFAVQLKEKYKKKILQALTNNK